MTSPYHQPALWQAIALSSQVTTSHPLACRHLNHELVLFRDAQKTVRALHDQCAHRRAPLSLGRMTKKGEIQCPYHGWTFNGEDGICSDIPNLASQESIPGRYQVQSYHTTEANSLVYLNLGNLPDQQPPAVSPRWQRPSQKSTFENHRLLTLGHEDFIATLLDSPSLLLQIDGVQIIDDHWLGEPTLDGPHLAVERVADWAHLAKRRKRIPSDYPLVLRIELNLETLDAFIELRDENDLALIQAMVASYPVTTAVTAPLWRWHKISARGRQASDHTSNIRFDIASQVLPQSLLNIKPYISSIWRGDISPLHHHNRALG